MLRDFGLEHGNQTVIHVGEFVRNAEADHPRVRQVALEFCREFGAVRALHHEHGIRPIQQLRRDWIIGVTIDAGGSRFHAGPIREDMFGGWAAQAVLAADEKYVQQGCRGAYLTASSAKRLLRRASAAFA